MRAISSGPALSCLCRSSWSSFCRAASAKSGTHSYTLPRAIPKKVAAIGPRKATVAFGNGEGNSIELIGKKEVTAGEVSVQIASAKVNAFWYTWSF
jgi:hypothetical protein